MNNKLSFGSKTYRFDDILRSTKTLRFISKLTNSKFQALRRKISSFRINLKKWIRNEGIENLTKRIKESERSYLLNGTSSWFSLRHFSGPGISSEATRILFSIHRNFRAPVKFNTESIETPLTVDIKSFWDKYYPVIDSVLRRKCFIYRSLPDFVTRHKPSESEKKLVESFEIPMSRMLYCHCDPQCDINPRTDGHKYPMRINLKSSANGIALGSQRLDWLALHKEENKNLLKGIIGMYRNWGYTWVPDQYPTYDETLDISQLKVSRLYPLQDKSCKTRIVAIFDNYSQVVLRPLHLLINDILKHNKCDFTFNHALGVNYLKTFKKDLYSSDLSSATDLIPVDLSLMILKFIIKSSDNLQYFDDLDDFIMNVRTVLVDRPFTYNNKNYFYKTGQPMGAYASFPLLALTNHFLVHLASKIVYPERNTFFDYAIVGDDCTIADISIGKKYHELCEELGIKVNYTKTVQGHRTFEFCRRVVKDGKLVSPPSINSLYNSIISKDPTALCQILTSYEHSIPCWSVLTEFFEPKVLRVMLATSEIHISGEPNIIRIPKEVLAHSERSLTIKDYLSRKKVSLEKFNDPYLDRLFYGHQIYDVFSAFKKKSTWWDLATKCKANTFYLGYLDTYLNRNELRKKQIYKLPSSAKRKMKLRDVCMTQKSRWLLK